MHIDNWVKASVLVNFVSMAFTGWMVYRGENPKPRLPQSADVTTVEAQMPIPTTDPSLAHFWLLMSPTVVSAFFLGTALLVASRKKQIVPPSAVRSKLKIHSAFYGIGNHNDIDLADTLQKMIPRDALAITVDNNLIAGRPDPAPNQPKQLKVSYSFGGPDVIQLVVSEHELLAVPRDFGYGREMGLYYEVEKTREIEAISTEFQSENSTREELEKQLRGDIAELKRQKLLPQLIIDFDTRSRLCGEEIVVFIVEGSVSAQAIQVDPIRMHQMGASNSAIESYGEIGIYLRDAVGIVRIGENYKCRLMANTVAGTTSLTGAMRNCLRQDMETTFSVKIRFQDLEGNHYFRHFNLTLDLYNKISVFAGSIQSVSSAELL